MPEIRKDYLLENYVIISTERAKRPMDYNSKKVLSSLNDTCPLCPKNINLTPGITEEVNENGELICRSILNKFKIVGTFGDKQIKTHNEFYTFGDAVGIHEVVIETPEHGIEFEELSLEHIQKVIKLIIRRIKECYKMNAEFVVVFKNRGSEAGASLTHSHHQIVSYNLFPPEIKKEIEIIKNYKEKNKICPYCKIIDSEKESYRKIFHDNHFAAFTPYASKFPFEAWILPKQCIHSITELNEEEIISFSTILKNTLTSLDKLGYPSFNMFYKISNDKNKDYHFRIEIAPRLSKFAGFEYVSGTIVNSMPPETAAKFYRNEG